MGLEALSLTVSLELGVGTGKLIIVLVHCCNAWAYFKGYPRDDARGVSINESLVTRL